MRVVLVRPTASGGLAAHVDQEHALLAEAGREVHQAPVRILERPDPVEDLRTVRTLRRMLRTSDVPLALHAHGLRAGALATAAMPGHRRHRLVVTLHNRTVGSPAVRTVGAALLRVLARGADTVLAVSPDLADAARAAGACDVRHAIVPAPVSGATPAPPPSETGNAGLDVLVIGRLAPQKGLHDLLDAVGMLERPDTLRIRIAGDGPLHGDLERRILDERLPVELLGRRHDVPGLLASCDLVVSAAHWEGQPVSLQEALRAGRAIVATDAGGTRWVTGEAACLVPVGDPAALAEAIAALRDPAARRAAEEASRRRALELPTAQDLLAQLDEVLAHGSS